ncbi:MAG: SIS domain-containing protein [Actinobacteria bacterium]|nr:SIS domain-containing protein [Actinomycetota bacterium]
MSIMSSEINEQADALSATLAALERSRLEVEQLFNGAQSVLFMARGTSDHVADYGQYVLSTRAGVLAASGSPSLATAFDAKVNLSHHVVIGISQSGSTSEIVESLAWAKRLGAKTVALTNVANSPLTQGADLTLLTHAGVERAVPATKTFSSAMAAMAWVASSLSSGSLDSELSRLPDLVREVLAAPLHLGEIESAIGSAHTLVVSGRGFGQSVAREIALKLKECALINASGLSFADLRHGPVVVFSQGFPLISLGLSNTSPLLTGLHDLQRAAHQAGAPIINIGGVSAPGIPVHQIPLPELSDELLPILQVIPGQKIAERIAITRGFNPDTPRGLNKVTQTV